MAEFPRLFDDEPNETNALPTGGGLSALTQQTPSLMERVRQMQAEAPPIEPERTVGGTLKDVALSAAKIPLGVSDSLVGLGSLATGGKFGKFMEEQVGYRSDEAREFIDQYLSPAQQAANQRVGDAEGFVGKLVEGVKNPSVPLHSAIESLGYMGAGGAIARGIPLAASKLAGSSALAGKLAQAGATRGGVAGLSAAGEGFTMAGAQAENIRRQTADKELTLTQSLLAAGTGLVGAAIARGGQKVSDYLGVLDPDLWIAGGSKLALKHGVDTTQAIGKKTAALSLAKSLGDRADKAVKGYIAEGLFEEMPQEMFETFMENLALGKPWSEGMGESGALGLLSGGIMGGAMGAAGPSLARRQQSEAQRQAREAELAELDAAIKQNRAAANGQKVTPTGEPIPPETETSGPMGRAVNRSALPAPALELGFNRSQTPPQMSEQVVFADGSTLSPYDFYQQRLEEHGDDALARQETFAALNNSAETRTPRGLMPLLPKDEVITFNDGSFAKRSEIIDSLMQDGSTQEEAILIADNLIAASRPQPEPTSYDLADYQAAQAARQLPFDLPTTQPGDNNEETLQTQSTEKTEPATGQNAENVNWPQAVELAGIDYQLDGFKATGEPVYVDDQGGIMLPEDFQSLFTEGNVYADNTGERATPDDTAATGADTRTGSDRRGIERTTGNDERGGISSGIGTDGRATAGLGPVLDPNASIDRPSLTGITELEQQTTTTTDTPSKPISGPGEPNQSGIGETSDVTTASAEAKAQEINLKAQEAATSPTNELPQPTEAQKQAGNYKKGKVKAFGFDISIENPAGSERSGTDTDGETWQTTMSHHYGYIKRSKGADGDQVDVFVGPNADSQTAFVIEQIDPKTGKFDEHKVMLGFDTKDEAKAAYLANYADDWQGLDKIKQMPLKAMKKRIEEGKFTKPLKGKDVVEHAPNETAIKTTGAKLNRDYLKELGVSDNIISAAEENIKADPKNLSEGYLRGITGIRNLNFNQAVIQPQANQANATTSTNTEQKNAQKLEDNKPIQQGKPVQTRPVRAGSVAGDMANQDAQAVTEGTTTESQQAGLVTDAKTADLPSEGTVTDSSIEAGSANETTNEPKTPKNQTVQPDARADQRGNVENVEGGTGRSEVSSQEAQVQAIDAELDKQERSLERAIKKAKNDLKNSKGNLEEKLNLKAKVKQAQDNLRYFRMNYFDNQSKLNYQSQDTTEKAEQQAAKEGDAIDRIASIARESIEVIKNHPEGNLIPYINRVKERIEFIKKQGRPELAEEIQKEFDALNIEPKTKENRNDQSQNTTEKEKAEQQTAKEEVNQDKPKTSHVSWSVAYTETENSGRTTETKIFYRLAEAKDFSKGKHGYIVRLDDGGSDYSIDKATRKFVEFFGGFTPSAQEETNIRKLDPSYDFDAVKKVGRQEEVTSKSEETNKRINLSSQDEVQSQPVQQASALEKKAMEKQKSGEQAGNVENEDRGLVEGVEALQTEKLDKEAAKKADDKHKAQKESEWIDKIRKNASETMINVGGKSLRPAASDYVEEIISKRRRLTDNELSDIAKKHGVSDDVIKGFTTNAGFGFDSIMFAAERGDVGAKAFINSDSQNTNKPASDSPKAESEQQESVKQEISKDKAQESVADKEAKTDDKDAGVQNDTVIGKGSSGEVIKVGNEAVKNARGLEGEIYKKLSNQEGIASGYEKDGKIHTPFYENVISIDTIEEGRRKQLAPIISKNVARINNAVSSLINEGYDYNDPLQFGLNKDQTLDLMDFSNAQKTSEDAIKNNLMFLSQFYKQFGLERQSKAISKVNEVIGNQHIHVSFDGNPLLGDEYEGVNYREITDRLKGNKATNAYYTTNARYVQLKDVAQTDNLGDEGVKVVFSNQPLSDKDIKQWELTPVITGIAADKKAEVADEAKINEAKAIEDFGEKLGGSRKDKAKLQNRISDLSDSEIESLPLSKIWPKENVDGIEDKSLAAIAHAFREVIPTKPQSSYKKKAWVEKVKTMKGFFDRIANSEEGKAITKDKVFKEMGQIATLTPVLHKIKLLENLDREQWGRIGEVRIVRTPSFYNKSVSESGMPGSQVSIDKSVQTFLNITDISELAKAVNDAINSNPVDEKGGALKFEIRTNYHSGVTFINKKGDSEYRHLKEFKDVESARDYLKNNYVDLAKAWEAVKERDNIKKTDVRRKENRPRTAQDWRKGKDVTVEQFQETFGFRGAEFGNWVSQGKNAKERQGMLNFAYDALMDLANILEIPTQAISLDGSLGVGFGSRGSGAASAHFEPGRVVINLTKTRGAGALAHEWFHALDNYFSRMRGGEFKSTGSETYRKENFITYKPERLYVDKEYPTSRFTKKQLDIYAETRGGRFARSELWIPDPKHKEGVRPVVEKAFADLVNALNDSPMAKRALTIDRGKSEGYWSQIIERGARSFENYVIAKMAEQGYHNDYLANVTPHNEFARNPERYPYLLENELKPIVDAFDNLFKTMETRETDKGVALFSKTPTKPTNTHTTKSLTDTIRRVMDKVYSAGWFDRLLSTGKFKVVTSDEAARLTGMGAKFHKAWHGSPHDFERFTTGAIGTGEGAQAYGYGLYFAGAKDVAEFYKNSLGNSLYQGKVPKEPSRNFDINNAKLRAVYNVAKYLNQKKGTSFAGYLIPGASVEEAKADVLRSNQQLLSMLSNDDVSRPFYEAVENEISKLKDSDFTKGKLYEVELAPKQDEYLLWDKPLSEQSEKVQKKIKKISKKIARDIDRYYEEHIDKEPTGGDLYAGLSLARGFNNDAEVSEFLHGLGIRGIKYLDGSSRDKGEGEYNYVIFDESDVSIEAKYSKDGDVLGFYNPADDTTYFVADNISQNATDAEIKGLMLHEIGTHATRLGKDDAEFQAILKQVEALAKTNEAVKQAAARVPADTPAHLRSEETLGYLVEQNADLPVVKRFLAWLRNALRKMGMTFKGLERAKWIQWANKLDDADLVFMAQSALKKAPDSLVFDGMQDNSEILRLSKEQGYKGSNIGEAEEWLRAVAKGLDMSHDARMARAKDMGFDVDTVYYHGTNAEFKSFDKDFLGYSSGNGSGTDKGFFFSEDKDHAEYWARNSVYANGGEEAIIEVFLRKERPIEVDAEELINDGSNYPIEDAIEIAERDDNDSIVIKNIRDDESMEPRTIGFVFEPEQIRSIHAAFDPDFKDSGNLLASFAGQKAQTADQYQLTNAIERTANGEDAEVIRQETGWHKGADGKWRFEINDKDATLKPLTEGNNGIQYRSNTMENIINHPGLFAAYPSLRDLIVNVTVNPGAKSEQGSYSEGFEGDENSFSRESEINVIAKTSDKALSTLLHEIQHGIQHIEGFAVGGNIGEFTQAIEARPYENVTNYLGFIQRFTDGPIEFKPSDIQQYNAKIDDFFEDYSLPYDQLNQMASEDDLAWVNSLGYDFDEGTEVATIIEQLGDDARRDIEKGSVGLSPYEQYRRLAGEAEARNTQARQNLTTEERLATPPAQTVDVADSDVIVVFNGKEMASAPQPSNAPISQSILYSIAPPQKTPAWRRWFGKSKMVSGGQPITFYHGTNADFTVFDSEKLAKSTLHSTAQLGHFFTRKQGEAAQYGSRVHEVFLRIEKPYVVTSELLDKRMGDDPAQFATKLKADGFDGLWIKDAGYAVAFDSNQVKLTENETPSFADDIRYSKRANDQPLGQTVTGKPRVTKLKKMVRNLKDRARSNIYSLFGVDQMVDMAKHVLPSLSDYQDLMTQRRTLQSNIMLEADRIVRNKWRTMDGDTQEVLAKVMHDSTLNDFDPRLLWSDLTETPDGVEVMTQASLNQAEANKAAFDLGGSKIGYNRYRFPDYDSASEFYDQLNELSSGDDAARAKEFRRVQAEYNALPGTAKEIFTETEAAHEDLYRQKLQALEDRLLMAIADERKRSAYIDALRLQFESSKLNWYYAPLSRFGDYWLYGTEADGEKVFTTFESVYALNEFRDAFLSEGGTEIGSGKKVQDMMGKNLNFEGVGEGFLADLNALLEDRGLMQADPDLQDEIYQMFLSTLPDVSMRKNSIHRKGVKGFEEDAMRSFAQSVWHGAKQLSNLKYNQDMLRELKKAESAIDLANSPNRLAQAKQEVEALDILIEQWDTLGQAELEARAVLGFDQELYETALTYRKRYESMDEEAAIAAMRDEVADKRSRIKAAEQLGTDKEDTRFAADILTHLYKSYEDMQNPKYNSWAQFLMTTNFMTMLAFSPSTMIVNTLQTPNVAIPVSYGQFGDLGMKEIAKEYSRTSKQFLEALAKDHRDFDNNHSIYGGLQAQHAEALKTGDTKLAERLNDELTAMKHWLLEGDISRTQAYDLIGVAETGYDYGGVGTRVKEIGGGVMHHSERFNREVTLLSNYRLGRRSGLSHNEAFRKARELNDRSHFNYSPENAPIVMRQPWSKLFFQFKKYQQNMLYVWGKSFADWAYGKSPEEIKQGRRTFLALAASQTFFAGTLGFPVAGMLLGLANVLGNMGGDDDDEPFDAEREIRLGLIDLFEPIMGEEAAKTTSYSITHGLITGMTPVNISSRLSLRDTLFRDPPREFEGRDAGMYLVASLAGPTAGTIMNLYQSMDYAQEGEWMRAAEAVMPKVLRDLLKAARFGTEDAKTLRGNVIKEMKASEVAFQALGFSSSELSKKYDEKKFVMQANNALSEARSKLIAKAAEAQLTGDGEGYQQTMNKIRDWNRKHKEWPIKPDNIKQSIRSRQRVEQNMGNTGIYLNPKLDYLRDKFSL